ncbi:unnamed protein product [Cylindrotheca closterium]|uniref:tetrahydrofolate synthase n=1 Tax=Cylindrotheca closterium TaxID=2856 RepID=A0AAD2G9J0_9STRA|nr:unnamed protein product [Cylindrotheca closterium]
MAAVSSQDDDDADADKSNDGSFESALNALFSPLHQSTTKEAIAKAAQRRTSTVNDMRLYWSCLSDVPQKPNKRKMIHITGTKGKGSTACFCESIVRTHGCSTGLFTSPHLIDIRERIRWNGRPVHGNIFSNAYWKIRRDLEASITKLENEDLPVLPGYFRMLTLMAYYILEVMLEVDVLIIEVGMGGRYDATNFWDVTDDSAVVCGVTKLDLDHTRILGNTVELIAWEKGGIFARDKADTVKISSKQVTRIEQESDETGAEKSASNYQPPGGAFLLDSNTPGVIAMFQSCAKIEGCGRLDLLLVDATGARLVKALNGRPLGLAGEHQYGNATLAVHLCQAVLPEDNISIENPKTIEGVQSAQWPGRCQVLERQPWTYLLDGAHTLDSMTATVDFFSQQVKQNEECVLIFNCSHERNPIELLRLLLPISISKVYFAKSDSSRPSPVAVPNAKLLLQDQGIAIQSELLEEDEKPTWQETLASVWKHLTAEWGSSTAISCNSSARMVLDDLNANYKPSKVLVTGSLYLVGSILTTVEWTEESSPDIGNPL